VNENELITRSRETFRAVAPRVPWLRVFVGFAIAFAIGSVLALLFKGIGWWDGAGWERDVIIAVHELRHPILDAIMIVLPLVGTNYVLAPIVFISSIFIARRGYATVAMHLVIVQLGSWGLNPSLKFTFPRERPTLFEHRGQYALPAFPSGHSIASVSVLLTIAFLLHRTGNGTWGYWVVGLYIVLNSFSRIYLGVHWPTDVIAGLMVGAFWLLWTLAVLSGLHRGTDASRAPTSAAATAPWQGRA
jgi:undecaprenyl-diphosphatase